MLVSYEAPFGAIFKKKPRSSVIFAMRSPFKIQGGEGECRGGQSEPAFSEGIGAKDFGKRENVLENREGIR